ncbi:hypothetical protein ABIE85_002545 [Bradyrhizobium diazoefficiens]
MRASRGSGHPALLLVPRPVRLLNQRESTSLVEASRAFVALEGPELQPFAGTLGDIEELGADTAALSYRKHVELLDPAVAEGDDAAQHTVVEASPHTARRKDTLAIEPAVFVLRMQPDEPRHSPVKRHPMDLRGRAHIGERELPEH